MVNTTDWPNVLRLLDDDSVYTLKALQKHVAANGHKVNQQAIYRWIRRRHVQKRGTIPDPKTTHDLVVWLGADLKNAVDK